MPESNSAAIKNIPDFNTIYRANVVRKKELVALPRYSNNSEIKKEHFIQKKNVNQCKGSVGTGYISLGVEQTDENGNVIRDLKNNPILKERTTNGQFRRFIKEYPSAKEVFEKKNPGKNSHRDKEAFTSFIIAYEKQLRQSAYRAYHFGHFGTKPVVNDKNTGKYYLVMHLIEASELAKYLNNNKVSPFDKIKIAKNLAYEVNSLGDNIIHDDLKTDNFMLDTEKLSVRAIDFDHAQAIPPGETTVNSERIAIGFSAPEKLTSKGAPKPINKSSDIYSATATIIDIITNNPPGYYHERSITKILSNIKTFAGIKMSKAAHRRMRHLSKELSKPKYLLSEQSKQAFIKLCAKGLALSPDIRPSAQELFNMLESVSNEFSLHYCDTVITNPINTKLARMKEIDLDIFSYPETVALLNEINRFKAEPVLTSKKTKAFRRECEINIKIIENEAKFKSYLKQIDKKMEELVSNLGKDDIISETLNNLIGELKTGISDFTKKSAKEKVKSFQEFKNSNVNLLNSLEQNIDIKRKSEIKPIIGHILLLFTLVGTIPALASLNNRIKHGNYVFFNPKHKQVKQLYKALRHEPKLVLTI